MKDIPLPLTSPLPFEDKEIFREQYEFPFYFRGILKTMIITKDFKTDGASIPRVLWSLIISPFQRKTIIAFSFHDFTYQTGMLLVQSNRGPKWMRISRKESDHLLDQMLKFFKVKKWRRVAIYRGLWAGGWWTWRKYRKKDV